MVCTVTHVQSGKNSVTSPWEMTCICNYAWMDLIIVRSFGFTKENIIENVVAQIAHIVAIKWLWVITVVLVKLMAATGIIIPAEEQSFIM